MPSLKSAAPAPARRNSQRVVIGCPTRGTMASHCGRSLFAIGVWDGMHGSGYLQHEKNALWIVGASLVTNARNKLVDLFLGLESKPEWLLMLDDDQVYPPHLIEAMMVAVQSVEAETRVKCLTMSVPVWRFYGEPEPAVTHNVFDLTEEGRFVVRERELPENGCEQIAAIGGGCIMVHREALERIKQISIEQWGEHGERDPWFRHNSWLVNESEDLYFCRMLLAAEVPLWVTTTAGVLEHVKTIRLDRAMESGAVTI